MGVIVKRPVHIKIVITDKFKLQRGAEIRAAVAKLDAVRKQINSQLELSSAGGADGAKVASVVMERLRGELRKNEQTTAALLREMESLSSLEIGKEFHRGVMEGTVEVEVGDDFSKLGACEIVIKDDRVLEIRDGLCPEVNETFS